MSPFLKILPNTGVINDALAGQLSLDPIEPGAEKQSNQYYFKAINGKDASNIYKEANWKEQLGLTTDLLAT